MPLQNEILLLVLAALHINSETPQNLRTPVHLDFPSFHEFREFKLFLFQFEQFLRQVVQFAMVVLRFVAQLFQFCSFITRSLDKILFILCWLINKWKLLMKLLKSIIEYYWEYDVSTSLIVSLHVLVCGHYYCWFHKTNHKNHTFSSIWVCLIASQFWTSEDQECQVFPVKKNTKSHCY